MGSDRSASQWGLSAQVGVFHVMEGSEHLWTTIATGVTRKQHGIRKFNRRDGRLVSSADREVAALWTMADHFALRSAVLGWWATYPAEPIDGVIVSERALKTRDEDVRRMVHGKIGEIGRAHV